MLINGDEIEVFRKAEEMLNTDYKILKIRDNPEEYLIFRDYMITLMQDLTYYVEELKQEKNQCES